MTIVIVPAGSPSHGGDVKICVLGINQPSLPTPFPLFLYLFLSLMALSPVFHSINSPDNSPCSHSVLPQWGAADAEIKVPSSENTELKRSPFEAWSRSVYSHTCYAYCRGFLPCSFLPFRPIHLHFFKTSPDFSCVGGC